MPGAGRESPVTEMLRVLVVEDRPADAELMALCLEEEGFTPAWQRVDTEPAYLAALDLAPDIILSDWSLPRFSGLRALDIARERGADIPFVIVSGSVGEEVAIDAMHHGADDYVLKDRLARLGPAVRRALDGRQLRDRQRRAEAQLRLAATVFESSTEGVAIAGADGIVLAVNRAFTQITGYDEADVVGQAHRLLQSGGTAAEEPAGVWSTLQATGRWSGELWNRRKGGESYPVWMTVSAVKDGDGRTTNYVAVFNDLGDVRKAQQQVDFLGSHDALTGLPNRTLLLDRLAQALRRVGSGTSEVAVLLLDLDRFGEVNDSLGHLVGDGVLKAVAQRISGRLGAADSVCRLGGDEFAVMLERVSTAVGAATAAHGLQELLAVPFSIDGHEIGITSTVGISMAPADGVDPAMLLQHAEAAMRHAKSSGRNSIGFFEAGLTAQLEERFALEGQLRGATARGELVVHYQPQFDFRDGSLAGAEALVRWQHPDRGLMPPGVFIPMAEDLGIIGEIGSWVLSEACRQVAAWEARGLRVPRVAVNLSAGQLTDAGLVPLIRAALDSAGLDPARLELEVTELMVMPDTERASLVLGEIRALGLELAMDDFGTGQSSLAQLKRLPLHRLKIDISFVRDIGVDQTGEAIIRATVAIARSLGLQTVAEGIERDEQATFLRLAGCDIAQGFLFGHPMPADMFFEALLAPSTPLGR